MRYLKSLFIADCNGNNNEYLFAAAHFHDEMIWAHT